MHVYELESDLFGIMLFSTLEKAKDKAIWCARGWGEHYILDPDEVDEWVEEIGGWNENNAEHLDDTLIWDFGDVATVRTVEVW